MHTPSDTKSSRISFIKRVERWNGSLSDAKVRFPEITQRYTYLLILCVNSIYFGTLSYLGHNFCGCEFTSVPGKS